MDLNKVKEKLTESEFQELTGFVSSLESQRNEARTESIEGRKKLKADVKALSSFKEKVYERLNLDDDADFDSIEIPTKNAAVEERTQFERKLKKLQTELETERSTHGDLLKQHRNTLLDSNLQKALGTHQFIDTDLVADYVKARSFYDDDTGSFMYKDGDKIFSLDEGVKLIASNKPNLLKAVRNGGSGFNTTATVGTGQKPFSQMTLTEKSMLFKSNPSLYEALKAAR